MPRHLCASAFEVPFLVFPQFPQFPQSPQFPQPPQSPQSPQSPARYGFARFGFAAFYVATAERRSSPFNIAVAASTSSLLPMNSGVR